MKHCRVSHVVALVACLVLAPAALSQTGGRSAPSWERYKVVFERSVFSRDRSYAERRAAPAAAPVYRPEHAIRLTGVVREGERYVAFVEDSTAGATSRLRLGDAVARGRISAIALDHVLYEFDGHTWRVDVGQALDGTMPEPAAGVATAPPAADSTAPVEQQPSAVTAVQAAQPQPAAPSATGERPDSVLERMRQRRQRELGR